MALQILPIGTQSFEILRSSNFLYVDKTEDIYRLITTSRVNFLSRPRRFGKSLLISTLDCLFSGKKELFEELWIYDKWDWTKTYPVLRFDFGGISNQSPELLTNSLSFVLDNYFEKFGLKKIDAALDSKFQYLLEKIHLSTGEKVVILIDEYDKAIIDNLKNLEIADEIRKVLHNFYQVIKSTDDHLRFVFLTGVSKFSKMSIFSGLNNLVDLTMDRRFSTLCGITQNELETQFAPYIEEMAQSENVTESEVYAKIKHWYDGFSWDGKNFVYNPFSTLLVLDRKEFVDFWFESGSPSFLIDLIKKQNNVEAVLKSVEVPLNALDAFDLNNINLITLLFQTGYLTVKDMWRPYFGSGAMVLLTVPNNEVRNGLAMHLVAKYTESNITDVSIESNAMMKQLLDGNSEAFNTSLKRLLSRIPYQLHVPSEAYYHSLFLTWLNFMGFTPEAEVSTNIGRIDAVWEWNERVVIAECKYSATETAENLIEQAFAQIKAKKYADRYEGDNKRIALLAIVFAGKEVESRMMELGEIE